MAFSKTIVLISGANQGIGLEISKRLATENPSYHILMGCRSLSKGITAASSFPKLAIEPIELDITSDSSITKAFATVQEKFDRLDVLINNAGISRRALPEGLTTRQRYAQIMDTNAISAACLTETFIPLLRKSSQPRIIFMTSELGSLNETLNPAFKYYGLDSPEYKASKAAMNMIMATNAVKLKDEGFKVNVCCPGLNATGLNGGMGGHPSVGDQIGLNMTDPLIKEDTAKVKVKADVRKLAVEDIDTIIRSFYDKLSSGKEENPLIEDMTIQEKKVLAKKEMESHVDTEKLQTR